MANSISARSREAIEEFLRKEVEEATRALRNAPSEERPHAVTRLSFAVRRLSDFVLRHKLPEN